MPAATCKPARVCHWEEIQGARVKGRVTTTKIWICEFPYRTMRRHGPSDDCSDCPVWQAQQEEKARERDRERQNEPTFQSHAVARSDA